MKCIIMHLLIGHSPSLHQIFISFSVDNLDILVKFYIHGSVHRDSILMRFNEMQQYAGVYFLQHGQRPRWMNLVPQHYDLYQKLQLQFYVLLMMGAIDIRNM